MKAEREIQEGRGFYREEKGTNRGEKDTHGMKAEGWVTWGGAAANVGGMSECRKKESRKL